MVISMRTGFETNIRIGLPGCKACKIPYKCKASYSLGKIFCLSCGVQIAVSRCTCVYTLSGLLMSADEMLISVCTTDTLR